MLLPKKLVLEHVHTVVLEVRILFTRELADAYAGVDAPRVEELIPNLRDDDQLLIPRERDVALVEQVVDVR